MRVGEREKRGPAGWEEREGGWVRSKHRSRTGWALLLRPGRGAALYASVKGKMSRWALLWPPRAGLGNPRALPLAARVHLSRGESSPRKAQMRPQVNEKGSPATNPRGVQGGMWAWLMPHRGPGAQGLPRRAG